jgi:hypothetical protein
MQNQSTTCQNCKKEFEVTEMEKEILSKLAVPLPTFCPECSLVRRVAYRNERTLYKRKCNAPGHNEEVISIFSPDKPDTVYCQSSWWGDSWDGLTFGRQYDFNTPFFLQMRELWKSVPDMALANWNNVNSDYCSITEGNKNCYLVIGGDFNENSLYSAFIFNSKDMVDCYWCKKCELCYEVSESISCTNMLYSKFCDSCFDSAFLFNCRNSHHCFGCVNLKNASYQIWNQQYTKEEYEQKIKEFNIADFTNKEKFEKEFEVFTKSFPRKYARILSSVGCTGDNINHAKNVTNSYDVFDGAEDSVNLWLTYSQAKSCANCDHLGKNSELSYECSTIYPGSRIIACRFILESHDISYSYNCHNSAYLFGCVGLRNKQYCIMNKQYTKEQYEELVPKIGEHMNTMPYVNTQGIVYRYGEFFPTELSPFAYNETVASELQPLSQEEIETRGYIYKAEQNKSHTPTVQQHNISETIAEVGEDIVKEVIACAHAGTCSHNCATAFRVTKEEYAFYKRMNVPLPHLCSNCRHYERTTYKNPLVLNEKVCDCGGEGSIHNQYKNYLPHAHGNSPCGTEFKTNFPHNTELAIYCEHCYQQEVS